MMEFARQEIEGSLAARFASVVARFPEQPALGDAGLTWTYRELDRAANLVAARCEGGADAPPILLLLGHGALEIIALLAVLKSGRAWVALDPSTPPARLAAIAGDTGAELVLTCRRLAPLATGLTGRLEVLPEAATLLAAVRDPALAAVAGRAPAVTIRPDDIASIVYTSGSTGTPKGVLRSQRSALHRCWLFQNDQRVRPGDRVAHLFSCGFVAAEVDVYGALLNGAMLCCYPVRRLGFGGLLGWLAAERITLLHPPPALWRQVLAGLSAPPDLPALRTVFLAGEAVFRRDLLRMGALLPRCTVVHRLSSSEASAMAQNTLTPGAVIEEEVVPAGWPVADKTIFLVDQAGRQVAPGEIGEIVVESRYLAPGYWRQPELTASRFREVPATARDALPPLRRYRSGDLGRFDAQGRLHHLGRLDEQVKVRGYRVEPREVEAALLALQGVEAAVVVARPGADGEKALVACLVTQSGNGRDAARLRRLLAETLPAYLIPSVFEWHRQLPLTPNGKIDRLALLTPLADGEPVSAPLPPGSETEERIAGIWREILGLERIGRDDDFFAQGGQSLLAALLVTRLNAAFGLALPLVCIYQTPTLAGQAELVQRGANANDASGSDRWDTAVVSYLRAISGGS